MNSGLRRARAQVSEATPAEDEVAEPAEASQRALVDRFATAIERADVGALADLLREDVTLEMPPELTWFAGRAAVTAYAAAHLLAEPGLLRVIPVVANSEPALATYAGKPGGPHHAHSVLALTVTATGIARIVSFRGPSLFASFGLPLEYPESGQEPLRTLRS